MKKTFLAIAVITLTATGAFAQGKKLQAAQPAAATAQTATTTATAAEPTTTIKFKTETHDFGTLQEGDPAEAEFLFTNTGKKTIDHPERSAWLRLYYTFLVKRPGSPR